MARDLNRLDPASATTIITIPQPNQWHNGGTIAFGPLGGFLYIGLGDGGPGADPSCAGQDPSTWRGPVSALPGATWFFQTGYRDGGPFLFTNGLSITFQ